MKAEKFSEMMKDVNTQKPLDPKQVKKNPREAFIASKLLLSQSLFLFSISETPIKQILNFITISVSLPV